MTLGIRIPDSTCLFERYGVGSTPTSPALSSHSLMVKL